MNISIIGRQFSITAEMYSHVTRQLEALAGGAALKITSASVVMELEKNRFTTNLVLNCKNHTLKAEVGGYDLYRTFDAAVAKVEHQIEALSGRVRSHRGAALKDIEIASEQA